MEKKLVLISLAFLVLVSLVSAKVEPGVIDGYIDDTEYGKVIGAKVSSNGDESFSQSNSYYSLFNADVPKAGLVTAIAELGSARGKNTGYSQESIAHINLTLCYRPQKPNLIYASSNGSHNTALEIKWASGKWASDAGSSFKYPVYDVVLVNGLEQQFEGYGVHSIIKNMGSENSASWSIKTCSNIPSEKLRNGLTLDYCCSDSISGGSHSTNNAPLEPSNLSSLNNNGFLELSWISGADFEGDPTYNEFREKNIETGIYTSESPVGNSYITLSKEVVVWEVRTCDNLGACSNWVQKITPTCEKVNESCPGFAEIQNALYEGLQKKNFTTEIYCNGVKIDNSLITKINLNFNSESKKISIFGDKLVKEEMEYCPWCYDGKKDYDEEGIDCGGSCVSCGILNVSEINHFWLIVILIVLLVIGLYLYFHKLKNFKSLEHRHSGHSKFKNIYKVVLFI